MSTDAQDYRLTIDPNKITNYLLNPQSKTGGRGKSKFFTGFGFVRDQPMVLGLALAMHALHNSPGSISVSEYGVDVLLFEGPLGSPDGRNPNVRSVWQIDPEYQLSFLTAVPLTR